MAPLEPQEKGFWLAVSGSNDFCASGMRVPARGIAALGVAIRLDVLLSSAVAQPLAALLPYGCGTPLAGAALPILQKCTVIIVYRSTPQCGERSNAAFGTQSAAEKTSLAPHASKARLQNGYESQGFMAKPCTPHPHCAARAVIQAPDCQCRGSRGGAPRPSLGDLKGVFSSRREYPLCPAPHGRWGPHTAPAALQNSRTSVRCEKRSILWTIQ